MPVFFSKSNLMEFQVGFQSYFVFCQTDLGGSRWEVLARVSSQCWNFSRLHRLPGKVISYIAISADGTTLYSKCDKHLICGNI